MKHIYRTLFFLSLFLFYSFEKKFDNFLSGTTWTSSSFSEFYSEKVIMGKDSFGKDSTFFSQVTFNKDFTFDKVTNGVNSSGYYVLTKKVFKMYYCSKDPKCYPSQTDRWFWPRDSRELLENNRLDQCGFKIMEYCKVRDKNGNEFYRYFPACYTKKMLEKSI